MKACGFDTIPTGLPHRYKVYERGEYIGFLYKEYFLPFLQGRGFKLKTNDTNQRK